ncbi:unnamed protein product [Aphanomyces euteiches]
MKSMWQCMALFLCASAAAAGEEATTDKGSSAVFWPQEYDDKLSIQGNLVISTGNMMIVHEKQIALDLPNVAWHPSLDAIDISFIPALTSQESNAAPIWSRYVSSTVHTLHDTAGMHIRIHHRGAPVDIKDLQSNVTRVLIDLLGPSYAASTCSVGCESNTFHFESTIVFANASCNLPAYFTRLGQASEQPSASSFCLVSSRYAPGVEVPTLFPSLSKVPSTPLQAILSSSSQIQPDAISEWHIRATHLTLTFEKRVLLNIQQVIESLRQGESVLSVTVSDDIAEAAKVVQSISSDSVSILKSLYSTEATSLTVSSEPTIRVLDIDTTVSGSGFHQLLHVNVQLSHTDNTCRLLIEQPFPTTAYADMDELRRMERFNAFQVIAFAKHIEIERPSALSSEHVVAFVLPLSSTNLTVDVPIHFRYQFPSNQTLYRPVHLVAPSLYLHCESDPTSTDLRTLGIPNNPDTYWKRVTLNRPVQGLTLQIPVGNLNDGRFVTAVTLFVSVLGCLFIFVSLLPSKSPSPAKSTSWIPQSSIKQG